jgi:hypothetical protein
VSGAELTLRLAAAACSLIFGLSAAGLAVYLVRVENEVEPPAWFVAFGLILLAGFAGAASLTGTAALPW